MHTTGSATIVRIKNTTAKVVSILVQKRASSCTFQFQPRKSVHGTRMPPPIVFISPEIKHKVYTK